MGLNVSIFSEIKRTSKMSFDFIIDSDNFGFPENQKVHKPGLYMGKYIESNISYSYSTHYKFRLELIKILGRHDLHENENINWDLLKTDKEMPFYELLYFSDCEGCIDHINCLRLYEDFESNIEIAAGMIDYYFDIYIKYLNLFRTAVNEDGIVVF